MEPKTTDRGCGQRGRSIGCTFPMQRMTQGTK